METNRGCGVSRVFRLTLIVPLLLAVCALTAADPARLRAQTLVYSFESGPGEFNPNGGGLTLAADTTGATAGTGSLRATLVQGATLAGALHGGAGDTLPAALGDPPGIDYVLFDLTLAEEFAGNFANIYVTFFGHSQPDYPGGQQFGLQTEYSDFEVLEDKAAGTYTDVRLDLTGALHPLTFAEDVTFNDIFGTVGSGPDDLIPSGIQIVLRKSNDAPLTVYIDNVRFVDLTPEGTDGDYNNDGVVDAADYVMWKKLLTTGGTLANDDTPGADAGDYAVWVEHFGEPATGGGGQAVPEPATAMWMIALVSLCGVAKRRTVR
jgi:hypothetical protein